MSETFLQLRWRKEENAKIINETLAPLMSLFKKIYISVWGVGRRVQVLWMPESSGSLELEIGNMKVPAYGGAGD